MSKEELKYLIKKYTELQKIELEKWVFMESKMCSYTEPKLKFEIYNDIIYHLKSFL
jgi:hypothetical protein